MSGNARYPYQPDYAVPPGYTLRETLEALAMSQAELARRTRLSTKHINQIILGSAPVSAETALALERVLQVPARFWNALEANYQARVTREDDEVQSTDDSTWVSRFPIKELARRGFISSGSDQRSLREQLLTFFGVASRRAWEDLWTSPDASFLRSEAFRADEFATACWLRIGEIEAAKIPNKPFQRQMFRGVLDSIRKQMVRGLEQTSATVVTECASAGVAVVFVAEVTGARASGAARWLSPTKALIQLSLRHKWEDHAWFSFFHEAGHILYHAKKSAFVERKPGAGSGHLEDEANRFASTILIPLKRDAELSSLRTLPQIRTFALELGLPTSVVIGRLQHDGTLSYKVGNKPPDRIRLQIAEE